ncbi:COP23 domain-containing protein [Altericista sp. CCNU0014]|uniref:COP23 domain-containing protein n=1 Tax=Altericista sp. CCNU0014 TaxID=3082949 RepID=UPI00384C3875
MKTLEIPMIRPINAIFAAIVMGSSIGIPLFPARSADEQPATRFFCGQSQIAGTRKKVPTTFARTKRGNVPVIRWQSTFFQASSPYTPLKRCEEVSRRFQKYYSEGILAYLTAGQMNSQNVICVSEEYGGPCQGLLLTLEPKDNPRMVLQDLLNARNRAGGPLTRSTGSIYVDMADFLEKTPVENDLSSQSVPRMNSPKETLLKPAKKL